MGMVRKVSTKTFETITAADLYNLHLQPQRQIVPELIAVGLNILAGNPKSGKSFAALQLAHAVATGGDFMGLNTTQGRVLYLALEDTYYRLKNRMRGLGMTPSQNLEFAVTSETLKEGGLEAIHNFLHQKRDTQLVIIDTLARIRDDGRTDNVYQEDSALGAALQSVAFQADAAILVIHHMRKNSHKDFLLSVSGSAGLPGAADVVLGLERNRHENKAILHITGRDLEEKAMNLYWTRWGWQSWASYESAAT